jgi:hypothetical protein
MVPHVFTDALAAAEVFDDLRADDGVDLQQVDLVFAEMRGFVQQLGGDGDLADIVNGCGEDKSVEFFLVEAQILADDAGVKGHAVAVRG